MNESLYSRVVSINFVNRRLVYSFNNRVEPKTLLREPKSTPPTNHLRKLPREIRQQIFSYVIEWRGETPNLIKGLRTRIDSESYKDTIHVLNMQYTFELSRLEMGRTAWGNIKRLSMQLHFNISENFHVDGDLVDAAQACRYFLDHFKNIQEFSVTDALFPLTPGQWGEQLCTYNVALGVGSEFTHEVKEDLYMMSLGLQMRMWEAGKGRTLSWDDEAYREHLEKERVEKEQKHAR